MLGRMAASPISDCAAAQAREAWGITEYLPPQSKKVGVDLQSKCGSFLPTFELQSKRAARPSLGKQQQSVPVQLQLASEV